MSAVINSSLNASARLGLRWIEPKDADIAFDPWNLVMNRNPRKPSSEENYVHVRVGTTIVCTQARADLAL